MAKASTTVTLPEVHNEEATEVKDLIETGENITPKQYFDNLKNLMKNTDSEEVQSIIENIMVMMKKSLITGQKKFSESLMKQLNLANNELKAVQAGFNTYMLRVDIELYIKNVENRTVKIIELENYERDIPDSVLPQVEKARPYFDAFYVLFTDYANVEGKKVEKERRDKDPILLGAYAASSGAPEPRLYFIADWVDDKCDLTLDELCRSYESMTNHGILHKIDYSSDIDILKKQFEAMNKKTDYSEETEIKYDDAEESGLNIPKPTLKEKAKDTIKSVKRRVTRKKSTNDTSEAPKKRGRKKKTSSDSEES